MATAMCGSSPLVVVVVGGWLGRRSRAVVTESYGARGQRRVGGNLFAVNTDQPQMIDTKHFKILK
jgi:hypothetical protein